GGDGGGGGVVRGGRGEGGAGEGGAAGKRRPCEERADGAPHEEGEAAGAEPVGQPDRVTAGIGGQEACRDVTRRAAGEHLPCLQERFQGAEHAVDGRCGAEELGEHLSPRSWAMRWSDRPAAAAPAALRRPAGARRSWIAAPG